MSDVEARREARRRKILENSEKRLQRITGVQQRNASYLLEGYKSDTSVDDKHQINGYNHVHSTNEDSLDLSFESPSLETSNRNISTSNSIRHVNRLSVIKSYKIPFIICIAFIINLLRCIYQGTDTILINKIFIPVLAVEIVNLFINEDGSSEFKNILFLVFKKSLPNHLSVIARYLMFVVLITKDLMIFFFFFVLIRFFLIQIRTYT